MIKIDNSSLTASNFKSEKLKLVFYEPDLVIILAFWQFRVIKKKLIRTFKKDSPQTYLDWDLNNHTGVPIASGIYLIHIDIPDIGEKVIKFLGGSRQVDLQNL